MNHIPPYSELTFEYSRSSGPGGQNVNKVNSKVTMYWGIKSSHFLNAQQLSRFIFFYHNRIRSDGTFFISSDRFRDREKNQKDCLEKLQQMIHNIWIEPKKRKPTRRTRGSVEDRLRSKKKDSEKKISRARIKV